MSLRAFLRESRALRQALEGTAPFSNAFGYTKSDLLWIRDNTDLIWDFLVQQEIGLPTIIPGAAADHSVRKTVMKYSWVNPPSEMSLDQEITFCIPLVKHAISILYCVLGRTSALEFIKGAGVVHCVVGNTSAVVWLAESAAFSAADVAGWQIGSITNLIGILAVTNFPTMRLTGACRYVATLEMSDQLMSAEFFPRLNRILDINPTHSVH